MKSNKPNFIVDPVNYQLVRGEVGIGRIRELKPNDASLLAHHVGSHSDTLFAASSGVPIQGSSGFFKTSEGMVAVEWVRREPRPNVSGKRIEPETNMNRFIFGIGPDGRCYGYDVTEYEPDVSKVQVGNHWMTLNEVIDRYLSSPDFL
jgi:hypothetical protein